MHSISKNLKQIRQQRGWTQQQMADVLFVTRQTISNWENGKSMPDLDMLTSIAEKLEININELLYGVSHKNDIQLIKGIKTSLLLLMTGLILKRVSIYIAPVAKSSFNSFDVILSYGIASPVLAFSVGMLLLQILKAANIINRTPHFRFEKHIKYSIVAIIAMQLLLMRPFYLDQFIWFIRVASYKTPFYDFFTVLDDNFNLFTLIIKNDFIYYSIMRPLINRIFSADALFLLSFSVYGFLYELAIPFTGPVALKEFPAVSQILKVINKPEIIADIIKTNYPSYKKRLIKTTAVFSLLLLVNIVARLLMSLKIISSGYVINYALQGIIRPAIWITSGFIIAITLNLFGINFDKKTVYRIFITATAVIFIVNTAVYIPYIIKDIMAITSGTSPVEYLRKLLEAPVWYRKPYAFFTNLSATGFKNKFFVYTLPAFIAGITKADK